MLALLLGAALVFPNSGSAAAQPAFLAGVAALHNFEYEDAVESFRQAQQLDPGFALAYWGEAMAHNQTLWLNQDAAAARQALARLGPTPEARAARAGTPRESGLIRAVEILYGEGDKRERDQAYAKAMEGLARLHPGDVEIACFHALALLGTAVRAPALFDASNEDAHQHALVGSEAQRRVAEILQVVLKARPDHPGALHYLIHDYDDPEHARLALPAARAYAKAAPASSHALHMPSHVFVQLGLWHEAAASDEAAFRASEAWALRKGLGVGMLDYHSLSWLLYESLQQGRQQRAREALARMQAGVEATGAPRHKALLSTMRAQYVVETRSWEMLSSRADFSTSAELFAIGLSAAHSGAPQRAELALRELTRRAGSEQAGNRKLDVAVMEKELAAVVELLAGRGEQALSLMAEAAALEEKLPLPLGPPRPVKPSYELYGEILLELGRPGEARVQFARALGRWPGRSASLLGLARAAGRAGDARASRERYRQLLANWSHADASLGELQEAKAAVAAGSGAGAIRP